MRVTPGAPSPPNTTRMLLRPPAGGASESGGGAVTCPQDLSSYSSRDAWMSDSSISPRRLRGEDGFLEKKWPRPGQPYKHTHHHPSVILCHPSLPGVLGAGLTGHSNADVSRCPGCGLSVGGAELVQVHRWLVSISQQHPVAPRRLTDAQTLHVQHHAVHAGDTGLGTGDISEMEPRASSPGRLCPLTMMPRALRMLSLQMGQVQCSFSHGSTHTL